MTSINGFRTSGKAWLLRLNEWARQGHPHFDEFGPKQSTPPRRDRVIESSINEAEVQEIIAGVRDE